MREGRRESRVVVITGASAGVGRATARALAREGASVALMARGIDGLAATAREVEALGGRALIVPVDVAKPDEVELGAETIEREIGPIDIWVNNAMVSVFSPVKQMTAGDYQRVTDVTYLGTVHGTQAALRRMLPRDRGVIIQVAAVQAHRGIPLQSAYSAAKHAVAGFSEALRSELLHERSGVRITLVNLPALDTPQFEWAKSRLPRRPRPIAPIYAPEVAARAIVWAMGHPRRELTVSWPTVAARLGRSCWPAFLSVPLERILARFAYRAQQTGEPETRRRPNNLWAPVGGDRGAAGPFSQEARRRSLQLWAATHRAATAVAGVLLGAAGLLAVAYLARRA